MTSTLRTMEAFYRQKSSRRNVDAEISSKELEIAQKGLLWSVREEVRRIVQGRSIPRLIELGAGTGSNLFLLRDIVPQTELVAADFYGEPPSKNFDGISQVDVDITSGNLKDVLGSADLVLLIEVIEHVFSPDDLLSDVRSMLSDGGHVIITTPNLSSGLNRLMLLLGWLPLGMEVSTVKTYGRPGSSDLVGHIRVFTLRGLKEMIRDRGFVIERCYTRPSDFNTSEVRGRWFLSVLDHLFSTVSKSLGSRIVVVARRV